MGSTAARRVVGVVVLIALAAGLTWWARSADPGRDGASADVSAVYSSRTFQVSGDTDVSVIGVAAPEFAADVPARCGHHVARSIMIELVGDQEVTLRPDPDLPDTDADGALLRHVELEDGRDLGEVLLEQGRGELSDTETDFERRDGYQRAQERARAARVGIWAC